MKLADKLKEFSGVIGGAATFAPDEYPEWSYGSFETTRSDIDEMWPKIRPLIKRDVALIPVIDEKLAEAFAAFEKGERSKGRDALWSIYNLQLEKIR